MRGRGAHECYVVSHLLTPLTLTVCHNTSRGATLLGDDLADEYFDDHVDR